MCPLQWSHQWHIWLNYNHQSLDPNNLPNVCIQWSGEAALLVIHSMWNDHQQRGSILCQFPAQIRIHHWQFWFSLTCVYCFVETVRNRMVKRRKSKQCRINWKQLSKLTPTSIPHCANSNLSSTERNECHHHYWANSIVCLTSTAVSGVIWFAL